MFSKAMILLVSEGSLVARTFVIAAVRVVLPWSTWPMVPMLQWGLVLSNLAYAIDISSLVESEIESQITKYTSLNYIPCLGFNQYPLRAHFLSLSTLSAMFFGTCSYFSKNIE